MLFTSFQYIIFLPCIVFLYWILPQRFRLPMLLVASYAFYMSWMPIFIVLILAMTIFNFIWGNVLANAGDRKKLIFTIGIVANLLCLGYFKYANFFIDSAVGLFNIATRGDSHFVANIILPLGVSFFTFEFIHYLFEIYRGNKPLKSFVLFALFAAFFPTQIAGPIKRYQDFAAQMAEEKKISLSYFDEGLQLIIIGMAKKLLLADNLAVLVEMMAKTHYAYGSIETWVFAYAFAMQIYFDFSGYTDVARGSALLFGYHIPINFNMPYIASNISDFWRRWHISLSSWLRDYLFIPLGGSRGVGKWATDRNLMITMALGGLWHGASWSFVVWGIYHGLCLVIHRHFSMFREQSKLFQGFFQSRLFSFLSVVLTFHVVVVGWVFFRIHDIGVAFSMVKKMVLFSPLLMRQEAGQFLILKPDLPVVVPVVLIMVAILLLTNMPISYLREKGFLQRIPAPLRAVYFSILILAMVAFLPDNNAPFIYFQF